MMFTSRAQPLPPELLSTIFSLAVPSDSLYVHSKKESPFNVSHVCSLWRRTALATSSLWSHLAYHPPAELIHHDDVWRLWLARSKRKTLRFTTVVSELDQDRPLLRELARIMVDNVDRWRDIHVDFQDSIAIIMTTFPPTLESLKYTGCSVICRLLPSTTTDYFELFSDNSEWVHTNESRSATAVSLLEVLHKLDRGPLYSAGTDNDLRNTVPSRVPWEIVRSQFEECSTLPTLRRLSVEGYYPCFADVTCDIAELICRCRVSLVTLSLEDVVISENELCSVLLHSFRLTDLRLSPCDWDGVFEFLSAPPDTSLIICPMLQRLELNDLLLFDFQPFVNMVVSRWQYASDKGIGLSLSGDVRLLRPYLTDVQTQELDRCIAEGLDYELAPDEEQHEIQGVGNI